MQILLALTLVFAAAWFVVLRPKPDAVSTSSTSTPAASASSSTTAPGVKGLGNAVDKAKGAVETSDQQAQRLGAASNAASSTDPAATPSSTSSGPAGTTSGSGAANAPAGATVPAASLKGGSAVARVNRALASRKVLAVLFYNPRAADDRAVRGELTRAGSHGGKVVKVSAPLSRLASFKEVTKRISVTGSPTIVLFDRQGQPSSLVGFTDAAELNARIADALAGALGVPGAAPTP